MKMFAVVLILASTLMTAYMIIHNENRHIHDLKTTIDIMVDIKNHAVHYLSPFREIIRSYVEDKNVISCDYLNCFLTNNDFSPPEGWKKAVKESNIMLTGKEKEILISFGETMCFCTKEQICEYSEKYIFELTEIYNSLNENKEKKVKTVSALTLSAGLIIILLLV